MFGRSFASEGLTTGCIFGLQAWAGYNRGPYKRRGAEGEGAFISDSQIKAVN